MRTATSNVAIVRAVGKGERATALAVAGILASLPDGFDPKARGALAGAVHEWACGDSPRPAVKSGAKGEQVWTDYGLGHDRLVSAVKRALSAADDAPKPVTMRVTLSGEGGGSAVIAPDHALYPVLAALITAGQEEAAA